MAVVLENELWFFVGGLGLLFMFFAAFYAARKSRSNWKVISAKCIDQEVRRWMGHSGGSSWMFMLICEFEIDGSKHRVTPSYWSGFFSEASAVKFLKTHISSDGFCDLYVNPDNPLQTEMKSRSIKEFLLH